MLYLAGTIGFILWAKSGTGNWVGAAVVCLFVVLVGSMSIKLTYVERSKYKRSTDGGDDDQVQPLVLSNMLGGRKDTDTESPVDCLDTDKAELDRVASEINNLEDQLLTEVNGAASNDVVWTPGRSTGNGNGEA